VVALVLGANEENESNERYQMNSIQNIDCQMHDIRTRNWIKYTVTELLSLYPIVSNKFQLNFLEFRRVWKIQIVVREVCGCVVRLSKLVTAPLEVIRTVAVPGNM
jgi:hypothetical protein